MAARKAEPEPEPKPQPKAAPTVAPRPAPKTEPRPAPKRAAARAAQSTSVRVTRLVAVPSPAEGAPGRTYYSLEATNDRPPGEPDSCRLGLEHVSRDPELVALGGELGVLISLEPEPEGVTAADLVLAPVNVVALDAGTPEEPATAFTAQFAGRRGEDWADGFAEQGVLTLVAREADAFGPGGVVVIRWGGSF